MTHGDSGRDIEERRAHSRHRCDPRDLHVGRARHGRAGRLLTVIVRVADGTWVPAQIVIGEDEHGRIARWFGDDGQVGQARLSHEQDHALAGKETAHAFVRSGRGDRVRLTPGSPAVQRAVVAHDRVSRAGSACCARFPDHAVRALTPRTQSRHLRTHAAQASASIPPATSARARPAHCTAATRSRSTTAASRIVPAG